MNFRKSLIAIAASVLSMFAANSVWADNVAIHTPGNFQGLSLSPNGKWACGVYMDAGGNTMPFRWNLESGSIEVLGMEMGTAWDVANDGTISGDYPDTETLPNHAPIILPCYWRGLTRYTVELPLGASVSDGMGCGITPDGHYMSGSLLQNGIYTPYIWKDGKLHRSLNTGSHAVPHCVAPDGQGAAGFNTLYNRTACYWPAEGDIVHFRDSKDYSMSPWNYARNFSPDGKKLVYWGGWEVGEDETTIYLYSIYDLVTGERKKVVAPGTGGELEFYDISNNELLVGGADGRGYVNVAGEGGMFIDDYLKKRGVNIQAVCDDLYAGDDYYVGQLPIHTIIAVSEDENVLLMQYYNKAGESCAMVLKMNQDFANVAPAEVKAAQLDGLNTVGLTWKRPVGVNNIRGYNVYRDGKKLNVLPLNQFYYYDTKLASGTYKYEVSATTTAGVETKAEPVSLSVSDAQVAAPYSVFARQKGVNAGFLTWKAPLSNLVHKHYYDMEATDFSGFTIYENIDFEVAISYSKEEMKNYAGHKVSEVSFIPLGAHRNWKVSLYTHAADGTLQLLYTEPISQPLTYGVLNTIKLATPQPLPQEDLVVAIGVSVDANIEQVIGAQKGATVPGRSDMLRQQTEADFISAYESSVAAGYTISMLSWAIDLGLEAPDAGNAKVEKYNVILGNKAVGSTTGQSYEIPSLADGIYTVGVEAVYTDGRKSALQTMLLTIAANYPAVNDPQVTVNASDLTATWTAPVNNDATFLSHASETFGSAIREDESSSFAFMIASDYKPAKLRGYDGYRIAAFRFYPMSDAIFTFYLYENGKLVCELEAEDLQYKQWNTCKLPQELYLNENAEYRLVIDCFDPAPNTEFLGLDSEPSLDYVSDLFTTDEGQTWKSFSIETGLAGNWMMGMQLEAPKGEVLAVEGYDVTIDGKQANSSRLNTTTYTQKISGFGKHRLAIDTWYPGVGKAVTGRATTYTIDLNAIDDVADSEIRLQQGTDYLLAKGEGVQAVSIYNTSGALVTKSIGDQANIASLPAGLYIVKVTTIKGDISRKVKIQ